MNLFSSFLKVLKVKHTVWYSQKCYNEHPNKYNLLGISSLLKDYAIPNAATKLNEKDIEVLNTPFLALTNTAFIIVQNYDDKNVIFLQDGKKNKITIDEFKKIWTGVVLIVEPDENSIEPNYVNNSKQELINRIRVFLVYILSFAFLGYCFANQIHNIGILILLLVNLIGIVVCLLLVSKQISTSENIVNKICFLFSKHDCNSVLESEASKIWGIGWSEIGLSYFVSNILILSVFPYLIPYVLIINTIALLYSFWSVWYQAKIMKQWCPLCIVVQILMWCLFFVYLIFGFFNFSFPSLFSSLAFLFDIFLIGLIYLSPLALINLYLSVLLLALKTSTLTQNINSLKDNRSVFYALLKEQIYFEITLDDSHIIFGNPDSEFHITVLTNPHCSACARMHRKIDVLLKEFKNNVCVQYIFWSFNDEQKISNYFLTYIYMKNEQVEEIFDKWFESDKYFSNIFFKKYGFNPKDVTDKIKDEITLHDNWIDKTKPIETPTIIINGYKLPEIYKFEDLKYVIK
jgi:uncharacterized membrane protein